MTPRIVMAYRAMLEMEAEMEKKASLRPDQLPSFYGQTAAGVGAAAAVIKGICSDDPELTEQLAQVRRELLMADEDRKEGESA